MMTPRFLAGETGRWWCHEGTGNTRRGGAGGVCGGDRVTDEEYYCVFQLIQATQEFL